MKNYNHYKLLLELRDKGVSYKSELKRHSLSIVLCISLIPVVAYLMPKLATGVFTNLLIPILIGALVGSQLYEFAVISNNVKTWKVKEEIINWEKVEENANKKS